MKTEICPKEACTGCLACALSCSKGAISAKKDFMGFSYPIIDSEKCISCQVCVAHCHVTTPIKKHPQTSAIYRYCNGDDERKKSASGAFVPKLIQLCYEKGYYVCGSVFTEDFKGVKFVVTRSSDLIRKMRKSKYVEAEIGTAFSEIRNLIKHGERVLFVGLPCQVAALKKLVPDNELLLTVDMLCHGNGAPRYYAESLAAFCEQYKKDVNHIINVDFRPKPEPIGKHDFQINFEEGSLRVPSEQFPYYYGFNNRLILRDSCYRCKYVGQERVGDITVGDSTFTDSELGESIVLLNTPKGAEISREITTEKGAMSLVDEQKEKLKNRFSAKYVPKHRKKICKIKSYSKLQKNYLNFTYVPLKYKIIRIIKKLLRRK